MLALQAATWLWRSTQEKFRLFGLVLSRLYWYLGTKAIQRKNVWKFKRINLKKIESGGKNLNFSLPVEVAGHNLLFLNKLHDMLPNIFMDNFTGFQLINIFL